MFLSYSFEILGVIASFGKVENMIPFVDFLLFLAFVVHELTDDVGSLGVISEIRVLEIVGTESDSGTAFDDGVVGGVQVHFRIVEVSAPELGSCHRDFAIVAVDEEDGSFHRSDVEFGVLAAVDRDLGGVLQHEDCAILQVLNLEISPIKVSRHFDQNFIFPLFEHQVSSL